MGLGFVSDLLGKIILGFIGFCIVSWLIVYLINNSEKSVSKNKDDIKILEPILIIDQNLGSYTTININYNVISYDLLLYCAVRDPRYKDIQSIGFPITLSRGNGIVNIGNFQDYKIDEYIKNQCQFVALLSLLDGKVIKQREESFYLLFKKNIIVKQV